MGSKIRGETGAPDITDAGKRRLEALSKGRTE
jgi:hypothetical protein